MPRTAQQNQEIREASRARLLDSAMILFAENGYAHTSMRKIANHAGVSVGLHYHYFDNKEQLLTAVFDNCMEKISNSFVGVSAVEPPLAKINFLVTTIFETLQQDPIFWGLFYSLRSQPAVTAVLGDAFRLWTGHLRGLFIQNFQEAGRKDPEIEAYFLYSLVEGAIQQYLLDPDNYPIDNIVTQIINQIIYRG